MHLLPNQAIYRKVLVELLPQARKFLWIVTADRAQLANSRLANRRTYGMIPPWK